MAIPKTNPHYLAIIFWALCFTGLQRHSHATEPAALLRRYHVHIISSMSSDSPPLLVHCRSRDDDLGARLLLPSQEYLIRFEVDFFRRTHFECSVQWGGRQSEFTAFRCSRDENRCRSGNCFWSVRRDGFYFSKDNRNWHLEYEWPPEIPPSKTARTLWSVCKLINHKNMSIFNIKSGISAVWDSMS